MLTWNVGAARITRLLGSRMASSMTSRMMPAAGALDGSTVCGKPAKVSRQRRT